MVTTDVLATFLMAAAAQRCKRRRVIQELVSQHLKPGAGSLLHQVGHRQFGSHISQHCCPIHFIHSSCRCHKGQPLNPGTGSMLHEVGAADRAAVQSRMDLCRLASSWAGSMLHQVGHRVLSRWLTAVQCLVSTCSLAGILACAKTRCSCNMCSCMPEASVFGRALLHSQGMLSVLSKPLGVHNCSASIICPCTWGDLDPHDMQTASNVNLGVPAHA